MASLATVLDLDKMASGLTTPHGGSNNSVSSDAVVVKRRQHRGMRPGKKRFKETLPLDTTNIPVVSAVSQPKPSPLNPMYLSSVHTYTKVNPKDKEDMGCSVITRHIKVEAIAAIDMMYSQGSKEAQHFRNTRVEEKDDKIRVLPIPPMRLETKAEMWDILAPKPIPKLRLIVCGESFRLNREKPPSLYIAGRSTEEFHKEYSTFPEFSSSWAVRERFQVFDNNTGTGCRVSGLFTLLPRVWVKKIFKETQVFFDNFKKILDCNQIIQPRGGSKVPVFEGDTRQTYFTCGKAPKRNEKVVDVVERKLTELGMLEAAKELHRYVAKVNHAAKGYIDTKSIHFAEMVNHMAGLKCFKIGSNEGVKSFWTAFAMAMNCAFPLHKDDDYFMGMVGMLGSAGYHIDDSKQSSVLQYFCFPTVGTAVALRNGDLLLFNPLPHHCLSSKATKTENVIATSLYLKTAVVGGNNNGRSLKDVIPLSL